VIDDHDTVTGGAECGTGEARLWDHCCQQFPESMEWREGKEKLEPAVATEARMGSER
jgi:hypothetical protein